MNSKLQKILTVDDDDDIRMIAAMVLKKKGGFDVTAKASGHQAIEYLSSIHEDNLPDLIMLDVMMPVIDGPQTLEKIKENNSSPIANIPIIFMTAKCQPDEIERLKNLGAVGVIPKPFYAQTLVHQINEIMGAL